MKEKEFVVEVQAVLTFRVGLGATSREAAEEIGLEISQLNLDPRWLGESLGTSSETMFSIKSVESV